MDAVQKRRILVVDDDVDMLEAARLCLSSRYSVTGFPSGEEAIAASKSHIFPVAIVDLKMNGISGIETVEQLKSSNPHIQTIILTGNATLESAIETANTGVFRFLQKPFRLDEILETLSQAFARYDKMVLSEDPGQFESEQLMQYGLSGREAEVVRLSLLGKTNLEIAQSLAISKRTVEKHMENVLGRFQLKSRLKLSSYFRALRQKFLRE